jgi:ADP-heptose:LPS heptosyltransferase
LFLGDLVGYEAVVRAGKAGAPRRGAPRRGAPAGRVHPRPRGAHELTNTRARWPGPRLTPTSDSTDHDWYYCAPRIVALMTIALAEAAADHARVVASAADPPTLACLPGPTGPRKPAHSMRTMLDLGERFPEVRKIAVLRANAIGDLIFALPALDALRAAYPRAELVLLGQAWHARFWRGRPGPVDRVVVVPPSRGVNGGEAQAEDPAELERFFAAMQAERFDLAVQLHGGGRHSNPFVRRLGARFTIGLRAPDAEPLDRWLPYVYFQPEYVRYLEVVALAGAAPVRLEPRVEVTDVDRAEAAEVVPSTDRPLVLLHPGAGDPRRRWPVEGFIAVADALTAAGARVGVIGTGGEQPLVTRIVAGMRDGGLDLCDRLSLGGLAGLMQRARVVVSNDSGPLHLAFAVGAATVGIFWCFNVFTSSPLTRARHRPFTSWQTCCPVCGASCVDGRCDHAHTLVAAVPVAAVRDAALELLAAT